VNVRTVLWLVGIVLALVSGAEIIALLTALALDEPWLPFAIPAGVGLLAAGTLLVPARGHERLLSHRSAFVAVASGGAAACVFAAAPLALHPAFALSPFDALFESVSGLTTTGVTVLTGLDALPRSLLLWRSLSQWLGGMGTLLLAIAVFPLLGIGGLQIYAADAPGSSQEKIAPRVAETARLLWLLYAGLTLLAVILFKSAGMTLFDAICHALTAISTAGFSTHDASIGYADSSYLRGVATLFMLIGGMSFVVLHRGLTQGVSWRDAPELRAYVGVFAVATALIALDLNTGADSELASPGAGLSHAMFQVASTLSTTGFFASDFERWPALSRSVLFALFFVGAMAGSTGGGLKVIRLQLIARLAFAQLFALVHPRAVDTTKLAHHRVETGVLLGTMGFVGAWLLTLLAGTAAISLSGVDAFSALCTAAVSLANIGSGPGAGPGQTYAEFATGAKLAMIALMVLGRLEIYAALVLLSPSFWRD